MSTFYLLPPRPLVDDALARSLQTWLPGLERPVGERGLSELLHAAVAQQRDTFLVFREDLPDGGDSEQSLRDGFGADSGDEVIELHVGSRPDAVAARTWQIGDVSAAVLDSYNLS